MPEDETGRFKMAARLAIARMLVLWCSLGCGMAQSLGGIPTACNLTVECHQLPVYDQTLAHCNTATCEGRCGDKTLVPGAQCSCEPNCRYLQNCCPDYETQCEETEETEETEGAGDFLSTDLTVQFSRWQEFQDTVVCKDYYIVPEPGYDTYPIWRKTVSKCLPEFAEDTELVAKCETTEYDEPNLEKDVVATSRRMLFKNKYCALCNNEREEDIEFSDPDFLCDNDRVALRDMIGDQEVSPTFLLEQCVYQVDLGGLPFLNDILNCLPNPQPNGCPEGGTLDQLCNAYTSVVKNKNDPIWELPYKNIHCAFCDGARIQELYCVEDAIQAQPMARDVSSTVDRFTVVMSDGSNAIQYRKQRVCGKEEVRDLGTNSCVARTCDSPPAVHFMGQCYQIPAQTIPRVTTTFSHGLDLFVELDFTFDVEPRLENIQNELGNAFNNYNSRFEAQVTASKVDCNAFSFTTKRCFSLFRVHVLINSTESDILLGAMSDPPLIRDAFDVFTINFFNITQIVVVNHDTAVEGSCSNGQTPVLPDNDDAKLLVDALIGSEFTEPGALRILLNNSLHLEPKTAAVQITWRHDYLIDQPKGYSLLRYTFRFWHREVQIAVCPSELTSCARVSVPSEQFQLEQKEVGKFEVKLMLDGDDITLLLAADEFEVSDNGELVLCADAMVTPGSNAAGKWNTGLPVILGVVFLYLVFVQA